MKSLEQIREERRRDLTNSKEEHTTPEKDKIRITSKGHGKDTFVYLNDVPLPFVYAVKVGVSVGEFTKVELTILAEVEMDIEFPSFIEVRYKKNHWWEFWRR